MTYNVTTQPNQSVLACTYVHPIIYVYVYILNVQIHNLLTAKGDRRVPGGIVCRQLNCQTT